MKRTKRLSLSDLDLARKEQRPFACLTAYDANFARLIESAGAEVILVGDSLGMIVQGHETTLPVSVADLHYHCSCVARATQRVLIMADMPFLSDITLEEGLRNAKYLIQAGAQVIKLECSMHQLELVRNLSTRGIAVCAHLGLKPQWINKLGHYTIQHEDQASAQKLKAEADALIAAGVDLLLLECVPAELSAELTRRSSVPVIGIGAGNACDGQVLVTQDMLGMTEHCPFFARNFLTSEYAAADANMVQSALKAYVQAVKQGQFPSREHWR